MRWSRRKRLIKKQAQKRRTYKRCAIIAGSVVLALAAADIVYIKVMSGRFYHHTTLNGYDVSGKTADEVTEQLAAPYSTLSLQIEEQGQRVLTTGFTDMGYTVDKEQMRSAVSELIGRQSGFAYAGLIFGNSFGMRVPFSVDEEQFRATVNSGNLSVPRTTTADAELVLSDGEYTIRPEVYGTDFEDTDLRTLVREEIQRELASGTVGQTIVADIPKSIYRQPQIRADDRQLNENLELYNRFCKAQISYVFGDKREVVDWETIRGWLLPDQKDAPVDEEAVYNYVYDLAATYDTYGLPRTFESTYRGELTIEYNKYGYEIDIDAEFSQLLADIYANAPVEREPVYSQTGYSRSGVDDLNGTYVEVDLSMQHLWFYKHGDLIVESDIISGLPKDGRETHEGVFTIPYKASPFTLKDEGNAPGQGWDIEVQYWMPFDDGQGLHDASWQSNFGGTTYLVAGSHGCINLPVGAAAEIYDAMEENVCILIYQ